MKRNALLFVLLISLQAKAQLRLQAAGPLVGYVRSWMEERSTMVGRFPVFFGSTDMDRLRIGGYVDFKWKVFSPWGLRVEGSYVPQYVWVSAYNPDADPNNEDNWISYGGPHNYKQLVITPLLTHQRRLWYVQAGFAAWYRLADPDYRTPSPRFNQYIFSELDHSFNPVGVNGRFGGGLTLGRLHAEVNYSLGLTSATRRRIMHQGALIPFMQLESHSLMADLRFDVFRRTDNSGTGSQ